MPRMALKCRPSAKILLAPRTGWRHRPRLCPVHRSHRDEASDHYPRRVLPELPLRPPATVVFYCRENSEYAPLCQIDSQRCEGCAAGSLFDRRILVRCVVIQVSISSPGPSGSFAVDCPAIFVLNLICPLHDAAFVHPHCRNLACKAHACWRRYSRQ